MADSAAQPPQVHLRAILSGTMLIDERWNRFRDHRLPYWTLYINSRPGAFIHLDGGTMHALTPDLVHLIPAWVRFDCRTTRVVPHLWTVFDLVGVPGSLVRELFPTVRTVPLGRHLTSCAQRMRQALAADPSSAASVCAVTSLLYAATGELLASLTAAESLRLFAASAPGSQLAPALALIDSGLDRPVGNLALARACGLSEHYFIRQFHRQVGQTPAQYRLERRIAKGARLLATGEQSMDDIASQCGFSDRFYFTRMFSRLMGLAPAAYRRKRFASATVAEPTS
jgi:AraC-like DNA-binding protein